MILGRFGVEIAACRQSHFYDGDRVVLDITEGNMEAHHRLRKKLQVILSRVDVYPVLLERNLYLGKNIPIGAPRIKPAPRDLARTQRHPFSTSIARRTSSTISTSPTRAFFRRSAP